MVTIPKITFRTVKVPKLFMYINGVRKSFSYMYEVVTGIDDGDGCFSDPKEIAFFKSIGLIDYEGSRRNCIAATKGKNFQVIFDIINKQEIKRWKN